MTISSKGPKHLSTIKSLVNYLIALTIYNPVKLDKVLEFLSVEQGIPQYVTFFDAVNDVRTRKLYREGLMKMEALPEESSDEKSKELKYFSFQIQQYRVYDHTFSKRRVQKSTTIFGRTQEKIIAYIRTSSQGFDNCRK